VTAGPANTVTEQLRGGEVPFWIHPEWDLRFPWLVQGTTGSGGERVGFDLGLGGVQPVSEVLERWSLLRRSTGCPTIVHSRQLHGTEHWTHRHPVPPGLLVMQGRDAHLTDLPGIALTVSVADCAPVSLVDRRRRAVALVHAGWRGVAGGILESVVAAMRDVFGTTPADLWVHLGPSICERCYEVGPEVHQAVWPEREPPAGPACIDLRASLVARADALGVPAGQVTRSSHCTLCAAGSASGSRRFFSHRAGEPGRQMGVLGIRPV
jgi:polyphenol oxidase